MVKNNKDNKRGLGRGLDSLIPKIDDLKEKNKNSSITLEDILSESEESENDEYDLNETKDEDQKENKAKEAPAEKSKKEVKKDEKEPDEIQEENEEISIKEKSQEIEKKNQEKIEKEQKEYKSAISDYELASVEEVKNIIEKNPRITLWSSKSSAVFRYLRKTRPEFSISKEASELIDDAVSKKYPEIWELFKDI